MSKYKALLMNDIRHAGMDPLLMVGVLGPLAILLLSRFGFPIAVKWLESHYAFDLGEYAGFAAAFLVMTIPMLIGMLTGLLMLDERDENVIAYYAVTPLMRRGYIAYRLFFPSTLCAVLSAFYLSLSGLVDIRVEGMYALLLLASEAPLFALFLAAFSANKVEGLALSKIGGLFMAGPAVAYFVPGAWQVLGAWIPSYWPSKVLLAGMGGESLAAIGYLAAGLLLHAVLLLFTFKAFNRGID